MGVSGGRNNWLSSSAFRLRGVGGGAGIRQDRRLRSAVSRRAAGIGRGRVRARPRIGAVRLDELAGVAGSARVVGDGAGEVGELAYDSRRVRPGTLFFCVPGEKVDGHVFAAAAVEAGAVGLVVERELPELEVAQVVVEDA